MSAILKLKGRYLGSGVRILLDAATPAGGPVWVQVAAGGVWKGHAKFKQISFDDAFFSKVIANFRAHPSYEAGEDGVGKARVVPFDYEHASEMPPTEGSIALHGAPACGWVLELDTRKGEDGNVELWALADFLDATREQIRAGAYQWTSVAIWPNATDKVTGKEIGPVLTSVAITNRPFVEGMAPLKARVEVYGKAESAEEFIVGLRETLELPAEADAAAVKTGLDELVRLWETGAKPPGYPDGVGYLLNQVRRLLGLRAVAMPDEIVAAAGQALGALSASPETTPLPAQPAGNQAMSDKLRQALITLFDVRDNDDAILAAAKEAAMFAAKNAGALAALGDLMKKFGAADPADLATKATAARDDAAKTAEFATKLSEALAALDAGQEEEAKTETEKIAASAGFASADDPKAKLMRRVLLSDNLEARRAALGLVVGPAGADGKPTYTLTARDPSKLVAFRKEYPTPDRETALLTTPLVAGPGGLQLGGAHTGAAGGTAASPGGAALPKHIQEIQAYPGDTNHQKAVAMLTDKLPGFSKNDRRRQLYLADRYLQTGTAA